MDVEIELFFLKLTVRKSFVDTFSSAVCAAAKEHFALSRTPIRRLLNRNGDASAEVGGVTNTATLQ